MKQKYAIIYPTCHGGNFLGELLTLGEDCYSSNANLLEKTTLTDKLAAAVSRYTTNLGNWISLEDFRINFKTESEKIDIIQRHLYLLKLAELVDKAKIIVADAFGNDAGIRWANAGRYKLFNDTCGMHHDHDKHYDILKNSKLPMLHVDMTEFLNPVFPTTYYKILCQQLGIIPEADSAIQLHSVWYQRRVKNNLEWTGMTDCQSWSTFQQQEFQDKYILRYNDAVKNTAKNLEETYHRVNGPDWPAYDTSDDFFDQLPLWVKQECEDFGIDWAELSMIRINNYTELAIKHGYPVDPYYQYTQIVPNLLFINQHTP